MKVAVFGSRKGVNPEVVSTYVVERYDPETSLVSGGADGVDRVAEQTWQAMGGHVISFRPVIFAHYGADEEWGIERWEFGGTQPPFIVRLIDLLTWGSFAGAAWHRDLLIAEEADRGVAFQYQRSRGTQSTIDAFGAEGKPCVVKRFE